MNASRKHYIRILTVDDDKGILELIRRALEHEGYLVDTVSDPTTVLQKKPEQYQLILLDVMMPGMDGFQLCKELRERVDCPILFLTAKSEENDLMQGLGVGGDDYITKPFGIGELRARSGSGQPRTIKACMGKRVGKCN